MKLTKLITIVTPNEEPLNENDFVEDAIRRTVYHLKEYIYSGEEYSFITTLKRRNIVGIHITGIGDANSCVQCHSVIMRHAINDNADEIIFGHNHPIIRNKNVDVNNQPSSSDLKGFYKLENLFSFLNIHTYFCIISGDAEVASYYFINDTPSLYLEAGVEFIKNKKGKITKTLPYVEARHKERIEFDYQIITDLDKK
jgi:hypothetical protein